MAETRGSANPHLQSAPSSFMVISPDLSHRQHLIARVVGQEGRIAIADLAQRLSVSEETIRRDVRGLAAAGLVRKVHGAVTIPDPGEPPMQNRLLVHAEGKMRMARAVAATIQDGESVMMDTGSTTLYIARELVRRRRLMVLTNASEAARILSAEPTNHVYLTGGLVRGDDGAVFGPGAVAYAREFIAGTVILSMGGIDATHGFMNYDAGEAEFAQALIAQAERVIIAADSSKFQRRGFKRVCGFEQVDMLVTDAPPPPDIAARLQENGVALVVADQD